jgi:thiamine pyrophosphate-dependent acetolactate synthase large subunit-like protein
MGVSAERIESPDALTMALREAQSAGEPRLLDVSVSD